jgi:PPIC-type PPIASE domain/SurA N-terminal domain
MTTSLLEVDSWRDLAKVNSKRSFFLAVCGAVIGLLLAGYALFTARGTSTLMVPAEDVALVNQQPISRSDYLMQVQSLYNVEFSHATREQRQKVLNDMIREELFVQRGKELDVASTDPDVRNALVNAVELEIASDAITSQPTEAALRSYYQTHPERYASEGIMTVEDFVFPANGAAVSQAIDALKTHAPTADLIARLGGKSSGKVGDEEFYFAAKIHLGDRLFEVVRALPRAGVSAPTEMPDGIHILYMQKNVKPALLDFAAARDKVLSDYRNERVRHLTTGDEAFLRKRANILIADDLR